MKYSLYEELLPDNKILSHLFLNCAEQFVLEKIAKRNKALPKEEVKKVKIDIELKIDGHKCNPKAFFEMMVDQYDEQVRKTAVELVKEKTSGRFSEIESKICEMKEVMDSWAEEINWNTKNIFEK